MAKDGETWITPAKALGLVNAAYPGSSSVAAALIERLAIGRIVSRCRTMVTERTVRHATQKPTQIDDAVVKQSFWEEFRKPGHRHKEDWGVGDFEVWVAPSSDSLIIVRLVGVTFSKAQLEAEFPEIVALRMAALADAVLAYAGRHHPAPSTPPMKKASAHPPALPRLEAVPNSQVEAWYERQRPEVQALGQRDLWEAAKADFPGVKRKQIEPFVKGRPRGRRPVR